MNEQIYEASYPSLARQLLSSQQIRVLSKKPRLGYYLVLNEPSNTSTQVPSLIMDSAEVLAIVDSQLGEAAWFSGYVDVVESNLSPVPLFAFLGLGMTYPDTGYGVAASEDGDEATQLAEALNLLFSGKHVRAPRHVALIDTGAEPLAPALVDRFRRSCLRPRVPTEAAWPLNDATTMPPEIQKLLSDMTERRNPNRGHRR